MRKSQNLQIVSAFHIKNITDAELELHCSYEKYVHKNFDSVNRGIFNGYSLNCMGKSFD